MESFITIVPSASTAMANETITPVDEVVDVSIKNINLPKSLFILIISLRKILMKS